MRTTLLSLLALLIAATHARAADPLAAYADTRMNADIPTVEQALGHELGERFTRHAQTLDYCRTLAARSDRVRLDSYGRSHLGRELVTLTISSPENLARLDEILEHNRALADPAAPDARTQRLMRDLPAIVWFSFSVHGNEGSNTEAALAVAYALAAGEGDAIERTLEDVIVVIDPCLNPDGRMRYVSWFEQVSGQDPDDAPYAAERFEPWPGGRTNHYLFDLNRDWVWGVHPESSQRVAWYRRYLPHLHIDWHEQGYNAPAFFGEGDTPYSLNIPESTKEWITEYTGAVADDYDAFALVFSTAERFDYLYPGYGKVLPCYHGAVGILNEQGGHSRGGLAVAVDESYTLTLAERIRNQVIIARAYIDHTAERREAQLERFREFFVDSMSLSDHEPAGFLISASNTPGQLARIWHLAEMHGIEVHALRDDTTVAEAIAHGSGETVDSLDAPAGSWWIPVDQPMGRLVLTLFERASDIEDPDTYDITGWSVPVMLGLESWSLETAPSRLRRLESWSPGAPRITGAPAEESVALLVPSDQWDFPVALGLASEHELFARLTGEEIRIGERTFPAGSLLVHTVRVNDEQRGAFERDLADAGLSGVRVTSGLTDDGPVLGANANRRLVLPKIMLPRGDAFSSYSFGQIWHMLDVAYPVEHTVVHADRMSSVDVHEYNVLVLPSGNPGRIMSADDMERWVRDGGTVVAIGRSARWVSRNVLDLEEDEDDADAGASDASPYSGADEDEETDADEERPPLSELTYAEREARSVEDRIPGALFRALVDTTHPLAFGATPEVGVIKRSARPLPIDDNGYALARFAEPDPVIGGAVSQRNAERIAGTPFVTHHTLGGGNVICFSDDITLRGFNHAGMRLLLNAITKGPSMARAYQPLGEDRD